MILQTLNCRDYTFISRENALSISNFAIEIMYKSKNLLKSFLRYCTQSCKHYFRPTQLRFQINTKAFWRNVPVFISTQTESEYQYTAMSNIYLVLVYQSQYIDLFIATYCNQHVLLFFVGLSSLSPESNIYTYYPILTTQVCLTGFLSLMKQLLPLVVSQGSVSGPVSFLSFIPLNNVCYPICTLTQMMHFSQYPLIIASFWRLPRLVRVGLVVSDFCDNILANNTQKTRHFSNFP